MAVEFDPDQPHVKIRGITGVRFHQNGYEFNAGYEVLGRLNKAEVGTIQRHEETKEQKKARQQELRQSAFEKIAARRNELDGYKPVEAPNAVRSALQENAAAEQAEENAQ